MDPHNDFDKHDRAPATIFMEVGDVVTADLVFICPKVDVIAKVGLQHEQCPYCGVLKMVEEK